MVQKIQKILLIFLIVLFPSKLMAEGFIVESIGNVPNISARKILIQSILKSDMMQFSYSALRIVLDMNQKEPRGKMQGHLITLSPHVSRDSEFIKLLVHEVAHYIDIYYLIT